MELVISNQLLLTFPKFYLLPGGKRGRGSYRRDLCKKEVKEKVKWAELVQSKRSVKESKIDSSLYNRELEDVFIWARQMKV